MPRSVALLSATPAIGQRLILDQEILYSRRQAQHPLVANICCTFSRNRCRRSFASFAGAAASKTRLQRFGWQRLAEASPSIPHRKATSKRGGLVAASWLGAPGKPRLRRSASGGTLPEERLPRVRLRRKTALGRFPCQLRFWARLFPLWRWWSSWRHFGAQRVCSRYQADQRQASDARAEGEQVAQLQACPAQSHAQARGRVWSLQRPVQWAANRGFER